MRTRNVTTTLLLAIGAAAGAQAAPITEICYSPEQDFQAATLPDNSTRFACPVAGNRTLAELAQQGYRIVRLTPLVSSATLKTRQQVVVQRDRRVHSNGFEQ